MATQKKEFRFEITEEMLQRAERYIPLARKIAFAETYAKECIRPVEITTQKLESDSLLALPQLYEESTLMKSLVMMQGLLTMYLHIDIGDSEFTPKEYDKYAAWHPLNQLERMKTVASVKDKVYDLIADYKELKKLFETEVYNQKVLHNDTVERVFAGISVINDPETLKKVMEELKKVQPPKKQVEGEDKAEA